MPVLAKVPRLSFVAHNITKQINTPTHAHTQNSTPLHFKSFFFFILHCARNAQLVDQSQRPTASTNPGSPGPRHSRDDSVSAVEPAFSRPALFNTNRLESENTGHNKSTCIYGLDTGIGPRNLTVMPANNINAK